MSLQPDRAARSGAQAAPVPFKMKAVPKPKDNEVEAAAERAKEARKDVSRLEFNSVDAVPAAGSGAADAIDQLKAEIAALQERVDDARRAGHKQVDEAKLLARLLARKEWEEELERRTQEDRVMVRRACEEFDRERTRYFAAVEGQVVKLALAIAGRVLHREAKMDPLLLSAAVRVALEKVKDESETRLRVPVAEVAAWNAAFGISSQANVESGHGGGHTGTVQVVGDAQMTRGECVIETEVGTVELGIEAQMLEIEQGFFDLLKKRPA